jgi:NAD-dependent DNA ligase
MDRPDDRFLNAVGYKRISTRQIDELIGMARMVAADGTISVQEAELLRNWLAANVAIVENPMIAGLYRRIEQMLADGNLDADEQCELLETLKAFTGGQIEQGEVLKATSLPLDQRAPALVFAGIRYCFTGTFMFGKRQECEAAVEVRGASAGSLTQRTNVLVIGAYATESWKHSSFGTKILRAVDWRDRGISIAIVSEEHWKSFVRPVG